MYKTNGILIIPEWNAYRGKYKSGGSRTITKEVNNKSLQLELWQCQHLEASWPTFSGTIDIKRSVFRFND